MKIRPQACGRNNLWCSSWWKTEGCAKEVRGKEKSKSKKSGHNSKSKAGAKDNKKVGT